MILSTNTQRLSIEDSYKAFARIRLPASYAHHATGAIMSQKKEPQFSAYVGIDWADEKHDIDVQKSFFQWSDFCWGTVSIFGI